MKMLFCIVQNEDAGGLVTALTKEGYRSTRYQSHGGFLRQGNATILVGAPDDRVSDVIAVVRRNCRTRTQYINPLPPMMEPGEFYMPNPVDVQLGGATIFVLDVAHFEQVESVVRGSLFLLLLPVLARRSASMPGAYFRMTRRCR